MVMEVTVTMILLTIEEPVVQLDVDMLIVQDMAGVVILTTLPHSTEDTAVDVTTINMQLMVGVNGHTTLQHSVEDSVVLVEDMSMVAIPTRVVTVLNVGGRIKYSCAIFDF